MVWGIAEALGAAVGAGVALVAAPAVVAGLGFTAGGIAAGSIAAKMMSAAAIANGGGVGSRQHRGCAAVHRSCRFLSWCQTWADKCLGVTRGSSRCFAALEEEDSE
ncbi:interferon alpha-inducible protein 27-like protein 2 [Manacus vitellinus]|uniref:interferon alpha-inducible protein 27-like protein 2 n=1 Tax=Manacus vitellinus TaxID=328815 RepID=UPI00115D8CEB|nr:interferon alpha-inducible protein 27-like protein 2 [Manacus vitellinus]XP_029818945.1 interferon alpha-inducible protein 27-like protein 2 [Manacus vitellinus]